MTKAVAILPARGGSKRIPRKNIKAFAGQPAIAWPLAAARQSGCFDRIIVSTDDAGIAEVARASGADVPFLRAADLSDDLTGTTEVISDAIGRLGLPDDTLVCCIYATALFVRPEDLAAGLERAKTSIWVFSAGAYRTPIDRAYRRAGPDGQMVAREPQNMPKRSQDLEPAYFDAGQFYWAQAATWCDPDARVWDGAAAVVLPFERTIDIDTPADWDFAERMFTLLQQDDHASADPD